MFEKLREENKKKLDEFKTELSFILNPRIRAITEIAICYIHPLFFTEAASSTGKHHPSYGLGDRGLLRHTRAAVNIAQSLRTINSFGLSDADFDIAIAALILHDSCKRGVHFEFEHTQHEHPLLVPQLVPQGTFCDDYDVLTFKKICEAISTHMGQWTTSERSTITLPKPETPIQIFVHECDYLASRKFIEIENIWTDEDKKIIYEKRNVSENKTEEKMTEAQERYIKSIVKEYQDSCTVLGLKPTITATDFSFLTKNTARGFIGKVKKLLEQNKVLMAQKS